MRPSLLLLLLVLGLVLEAHAEPEFPLTEDSKPHADIPHGELIKGQYTAKEGSVFPGTERDYTIYIPAGLDKTKPAPFMVFQDGVIYDAPVVFDNLIAKKQIPPLIGIFIKPGVVPAANPNANPRLNRCYEYDSVTDAYARFLLDEFLPAIEAKHGIKLSTDPDDAAIAGNSSGGICAFMAAWHRPDRIRRVFSGVGTYVGIHGGDQLPVLIRKYEPRPLRVFLQSGTHDNNLYCGDWWMANQMMERSLTWNGYDVNHAWGEGGHSQKHASQIFPDVMRWLWRDFASAKQIKANPRGESKWKGYEVIGDGKWEVVVDGGVAWPAKQHERYLELLAKHDSCAEIPTTPTRMSATASGDLFAWLEFYGLCKIHDGSVTRIPSPFEHGAVNSVSNMLAIHDGNLVIFGRTNGPKGNQWQDVRLIIKPDGKIEKTQSEPKTSQEREETHEPNRAGSPVCRFDGMALGLAGDFIEPIVPETGLLKEPKEYGARGHPDRWSSAIQGGGSVALGLIRGMTFSPDQSLLYFSNSSHPFIHALQILPDGKPGAVQAYFQIEGENPFNSCGRMCVDTKGWLYVATALGIQVCDTSGRVNFIIPTPQQPHDVCFGGKDLGELFIACGDKIYKRPTKAHGYVSGQMAPIKLANPKL